MINKKQIVKLANECLFGTDRFIVAVKIGTDNNIRVFIDGDDGVKIKHCVELSRHIEGSLDREEEDFELNVASAGADQPFSLLRQYTNNIGNTVQVIDMNGNKIRGILEEADETGVKLLEVIKNKNKKIKKTTIGELISIPTDNIKETKRIITF